ncbi:NTP transferase domain-containing protein [Crenothrix sp.]|uniref:nucleotidyltransferase family protein n=1 Tax=Crenothrix sp. TaxID=3100433 RepID=UPI00374C8A9D
MPSKDRHGHVGLLLLAAGSSKRLGTPKQLLIYKQQSLMRHTAKMALASYCQPIVVVLGAHAEKIQTEVAGLPLKTVVNTAWPEGMGSSIAAGMSYLTKGMDTCAVILMLCDQPYVDTEIINKLVITYRSTNAQLIAADYENTVGVPALFGKPFYQHLLALTGQQGAKSILLAHSASLITVSVPEAATDIDTPADYENIQ